MITRAAKPAMSGSCVTSTMVMPVAPQLLEQRHHLDAGLASRGCRSARRPGSPCGCVTSARAIATRCCWPPDIWFGWWSTRSPRPTRSSASRARLCRSRGRHVRVQQRQLDVLERAGARQQVEALEHEAERPVADVAPARRESSRETSWPSRRYSPDGRLVEAAEDVHQRRLARARRAHHRDELARRRSAASRRAARAPRRRPACRPW